MIRIAVVSSRHDSMDSPRQADRAAEASPTLPAMPPLVGRDGDWKKQGHDWPWAHLRNFLGGARRHCHL